MHFVMQEQVKKENNKQIKIVNPLMTKNESSPIFAKLPRGMLSLELFEFLRYLYPFKSYAKFLVFRFF